MLSVRDANSCGAHTKVAMLNGVEMEFDAHGIGGEEVVVMVSVR